MLKSVALSLGLAAGANAFWRMECPGVLDVARLDPIVNPGVDSAHAHSVAGSSGFSASANYSDLRGGDCTTCRVTQDKSNYWHPALYFEDAATGKFELVPQVGGMLAYYLLYGDNIKAFPEGFRMVAGDTKRRSYTLGNPSQPDPPKSRWSSMGQTKQSDLVQRAVGFNCLNYQKAPEGTLYRHHLPNKAYLDDNCSDGVRIEMMFPSCWNGKDIDSKNHHDHVAYPDLVMNGECPPGYSTRLPSLLYEVIWNTNAFKNRNGRFVVANGDTTGFGYHADFMMGWDEQFLQSAVNTCTNPSGRIEDCPLFNVVDHAKATSCNMQKKNLLSSILSDNIKGPANILPGNVKITYKDGKPSDSETNSEAKPYKPGSQPTNKASPLPGNVFKEKAKESSSAPAPPPPPPTTSAPPPPAHAAAEKPTPTPSFWSTQFVTEGNVVSKILWAEQVVTVTEGVPAEATATVVPVPARKRRSHLHGHARRNF